MINQDTPSTTLDHFSYVLLSEPYAAEAVEARRRGWPVRELSGTHLDIVTRPVLVAGAIISLAGQLA